MDRLEEFIRKNREDLDRLVPSDKAWDNIRRNVGKDKRSFSYKWLYAAAAAALLVIAFGAGIYFKSSTGLLAPEANYPGYADLRDVDKYYGNIINTMYSEAKPFLTEYPELAQELANDINRLDSIFSDIRKDLKDDVASEEVITALIQSYRVKIGLLEDMLNILRENESSENGQKTESYEI
ncbi:MAG TPA: hypothetical protein VHO50_04000 [Bacteroidales bacterium]|nr:hypothetical protein [Bacteroidales bacterium]